MNKFNYIYDSIKWIKRSKNKDDIFIFNNEKINLFILFDWVSSSINAKKWINFVKKYIWKNINNYIIDWHLELKKLIFDSNNELLKKNIVNSFTTCSILSYSLLKDEYKIINIWDSRIYWIFLNYKKRFTIDDNLDYNKNILTKYLWININYDDLEEEIIYKEYTKEWNILLCSDWFYNIYENNILLFHKVLNYKRLWNIKNRLKKEINKKNIDDSSYIYILTK